MEGTVLIVCCGHAWSPKTLVNLMGTQILSLIDSVSNQTLKGTILDYMRWITFHHFNITVERLFGGSTEEIVDDGAITKSIYEKISAFQKTSSPEDFETGRPRHRPDCGTYAESLYLSCLRLEPGCAKLSSAQKPPKKDRRAEALLLYVR